jgi:hypothetical protein
MRTLAAVAAVILALCAAQAIASEEPPEEPERERWWIAPPPGFVPYFTADPRRPQSALLYATMLDSEIPESDGPRTIIRLGGRFGLFRYHPAGDPDRGIQLDIEAGFYGHFDLDNSLDNIGWDGVYGLLLSWKPKGRLGFRFGTKHDSAHMGDEYAERTGRDRIGYTREELTAACVWQVSGSWQVYGELGYGHNIKEFMEPFRLQSGVQWVSSARWWKGSAAWYGALDVQAFEERDWRLTPTLQFGFQVPTGRGTSRYRVALEYSSGRSALGEFSFYDESYVGLGLYFDF